MRLLSILLRAMPMAVAAILISGCAGSGYFKDLNRYARKAKGPDISSSAAATEPVEDNKGMEAKSIQSEAETDVQDEENVENGTDEDAFGGSKADSLSSYPGRQTTGNVERTESHTSFGSGSLVFNASTSAEDRVESESTEKLRQSERQPPEIDWSNNSRKDWFFLIMAGLGLVVGLFGQGFGWVVFLIFGGLFLYRKIVRRK